MSRSQKKIDKINFEIFTLTYGEIVTTLLKDYEDVEEVNNQLDKMGYSMGIRMVDEFLAFTGLNKCSDFRDTADAIANKAFPLFLGFPAGIQNFDEKKKEFSLVLDQNPLIEFVELPPKYKGLFYCNILCGIIRGSLEMLQIDVEAKYKKCVLRGDERSEIFISLKQDPKKGDK
ncbi:trafficking protein particle complex subunit [Anaeramoeba ignava]|uniref:Trafficking protein particle complex subunit n=1 Tax=Anaeramoeba ignava TaxID=1746090 RepID=A0A9Q0LXU3_ANAIG|nr:trafficking protein particle complex subunit [Anaeramoeba ignava]